MRVLAGDIGGTNVRLAVVEANAESARVVTSHTAAVADHTGLTEPVRAFLDQQGERPTQACFGIAGTIEGRVLTGVNLPWVIDADALERDCGLERVHLINDFHAAARGVEALAPQDLLQLNPGVAKPGAPRAILGAGTGLGQAFMFPEPDGGWRVVGTEGGHRDFGPRTVGQDKVLDFLRRKHGRVSTERVLSGPGLEAIYESLLLEGRAPADEVHALPPGARGEAISRLGLTGDHATCRDASQIFVQVYGAEAGNVALTVLAAGGVYLAGGIAPALFAASAASRASFRGAFCDTGRFADWCAQVPVWCVTNGDLALLGAALEVASGR